MRLLKLGIATLFLPLIGLAQSPTAGMSQRTAARILEQATWGPTTASIQELQTLGFDKWYADQLSAPISTFADQPATLANGDRNSNPQPVQRQFFQNALTGKDQLRQRIAFALSEIWVVSNVDLDSAAAFPPILKIFQNDALGSYLQLMHDVTVNPSMGHYLNMAGNEKADPKTGTAANENYARELMQLFTLGLDELNLDGTPVTDSSRNVVPTYTQDTVANMAKVCTGWTYAPQPGAVSKVNNPEYFLLPMVSFDSEHDVTAKAIFGQTIPAGNSAATDMNSALQIIFNQPTIAPFISKQLIQHLVTSNPSAAYVKRVATVFESDAKGRRGNLASVVYQILTDPEARAGDTQPPTADFGHMREPVLLTANLLRSLNGKLGTTSNVAGYTGVMGQTLFEPASVFSYFPPNYTTSGILAPELDIYTTQTSASRADIINDAVFNGKFDADTTFDITPFVTAAGSADQTAFFDLLNQLFFHENLSSQTKAAMQTAMSAVSTAAEKAEAGLYIALNSSEFQIIH
jgi:uncharacterized protein (DUF1800 family)